LCVNDVYALSEEQAIDYVHKYLPESQDYTLKISESDKDFTFV